MPATIDDKGIQIPTIDEIEGDVQTDQRAEIDANLNVETGLLAKLNGIVASKIREVYELLLGVHDQAFPDKATGEPLSGLAALTGTERREATASTVECALELDDGTYPAGSLVAHVSGDAEATFENRDEIVVSSGANPETVTGEVFVAQETGPVAAPSGSLTEPAVTVTGWSDNTTPITNPFDASLGRETETDEELRARREIELAGAGSGTAAAIRAAISQLDGIVGVQVYENTSDEVGGPGNLSLPPKSFRAVAWDGTAGGTATTDQAIADAVWENKPVGIEPDGSTSVEVTDDLGTHVSRFSRPGVVDMYSVATLLVDSDDYAGDSEVKQAVVDRVNEIREVGKTVYASQLYAAVLAVNGVVHVDSLTADDSSPATTDAVEVALNEIVDPDTSRVTVNTSEA